MKTLKYILLLCLILPLTSADIVIDNTKTTDIVLKGAGYSDLTFVATNSPVLAAIPDTTSDDVIIETGRVVITGIE